MIPPLNERVRIPEADLIMSDQEQAEAFFKGGENLMPLYLHHLEKLSKILKPGMRVLDLGCGSGQLLMLASQIFSEVEFIGRDLSQAMISIARESISKNNIKNVQIEFGDMSQLQEYKDSSIDAVVSSLALHHLPSKEYFFRTFAEVNRVLKPGGGVVFSDLGFLKHINSISLLAADRKGKDPEIFIKDYENSLLAAFPNKDWSEGLQLIHKTNLNFSLTRPVCFLTQAYSSLGAEYPGADLRIQQKVKSLQWEEKINYHLLRWMQSN